MAELSTTFTTDLEARRWAVHHGDALDGLHAVGDESVDAIVTDPPYCSGAAGEAGRARAPGQGLRTETTRKLGWFVGDNMTTGGLTFLLRAVAFEATRVLKVGGSLCVFCDWRMVPALEPALESAGLRWANTVVWDKTAMGLGTGFRMQHELMLHFTHGIGAFHNMGLSNVLRVARVGREEREHQTQKPVELLRKIVRVVAPKDGLVIDPFAGSGSTGVACLEEGVRFLGVERAEAHVVTARARLEATSRQTVLALGGDAHG